VGLLVHLQYGVFGTQMICETNLGSMSKVPMTFNGGLSYFKITLPTDEQLHNETIPHVKLTSKMLLNPSKYDNNGLSTNLIAQDNDGVDFFGHQPPLPITFMNFWSTRSAN
jgi:hypothetical protein